MRTTHYQGCWGYNDSPDELGEPFGFWHFEEEAHMWGALTRSEGLNAAFETLGAPTYSAVLLVAHAQAWMEGLKFFRQANVYCVSYPFSAP